jgi:hypothetical protein
MDHSLICGKTPFLVPDIGLGVRSASGENVGENWMRRHKSARFPHRAGDVPRKAKP